MNILLNKEKSVSMWTLLVKDDVIAETMYMPIYIEINASKW